MAMTDTRNQTWANDKSKFGYKMLQKMGWAEGKGLGVKENGSVNHVHIRRKTSKVGVGGETNLDAWNRPAEVAAGLNAVLARLTPVNCEKAVVKQEKASKKGRGYYERRSAGKNVGAYSDSDLKEIFGGINVDRDTEDEKQRVTAGRDQKGGQEGEGCIKNITGSVEKAGGTENDPGAKEERKRCRKEKARRAKRKSAMVEATIKKSKKSKKSKKDKKRKPQ